MYYSKLIDQQLARISRVSCYKNHCSMRICYSIDREIKYINLPSIEDAAKFLAKHRVIDKVAYVGKDKVLKMLQARIVTKSNDKGGFTQKLEWVEVKWDEIEITPFMAKTFAAINELSAASMLAGIAANFTAYLGNSFRNNIASIG